MIPVQKIKNPPSEFIALREKNAEKPTADLKNDCRKLFENAFNLKVSRSLKSARLKADLEHWLMARRPETRFLEHVEIFEHRIWGFFLVVTQPFYSDGKEEAILLESLGCEVLDLAEWSYHYPWRASCFGVIVPASVRKIFTMSAVNAIDLDGVSCFFKSPASSGESLRKWP